MCGQSVHERLQKMGVKLINGRYTQEEIDYLTEHYIVYRDIGQLQTLADELGRPKTSICAKARSLGLTGQNHERTYLRRWKDMPESAVIALWDKFKRSKKTMSDFCRSNHYNIQSFHDAMNKYFPDEYDEVVASKRPRRTQYARGRDFEYAVRDDMRKHGYLALRSPASKSPVDIYCIKTGELIFIQCKLHGALYREEWNSFFTFCDSVNATPVMARKPDSGRGIEYFELLDFKDESRKKSPMKPWEPTDTTEEEA